MQLIEIRSYKLKPSTSEAFHQLFTEKVVPMLAEWGTDVVAFGPSPGEEDGYFLIRSYRDHAELTSRQDHFYASQEWRKGPREAVVAKIDVSLNTLVWLSQAGVEDLRISNRRLEDGADSR
jgi:quinol monooxygenase YgiN